MLAQRVEFDRRPVGFDRAQLGRVFHQHGRRIYRIKGDAVRIAVDEALLFLGAVTPVRANPGNTQRCGAECREIT